MDKVNTNQMVNYMAKMSPDGRFFSAAAFTADVKIWELQWGKAENDPVKVAKVMNLQVRRARGVRGQWRSVAAGSLQSRRFFELCVKLA